MVVAGQINNVRKKFARKQDFACQHAG